VAANTFLRSLFASGFPLFASKMYARLGVERATMILGAVGVVLMPIAWFSSFWDSGFAGGVDGYRIREGQTGSTGKIEHAEAESR
jgi:hypothetical protein